MKISRAARMEELAPYLFAELDRKKKEAQDKGVDVISLTIGDPDLPTPEDIVAEGQAALARRPNHQYPAYNGSASFRQEAARWMKRRFDVDVDPDTEIAALIGSKEGIAHLPFVFVDPGDVVLCPEPGYPVYDIATRLAGGTVHHLPLLADNGFLPDLGAVPAAVAERAKILWINYPNNPTGAVAPLEFYEEAVAFCRRNSCLLAVDAAYSEIGFDGYQAPSIFEIDGAREVALEFHSLSKTFNMTGWRVGFVAGAASFVQPLADLKSNLDSGVFTAVQDAAIAALRLWPAHLPELNETYRRRRDRLVSSLRRAGYDVVPPQATFYVWMAVPGGDDVSFASDLIERAGVLVTPGSGFGPSGAGYVRFSLTVDEDRLDEAVARLGTAGAGSR